MHYDSTLNGGNNADSYINLRVKIEPNTQQEGLSIRY